MHRTPHRRSRRPAGAARGLENGSCENCRGGDEVAAKNYARPTNDVPLASIGLVAAAFALALVIVGRRKWAPSRGPRQADFAVVRVDAYEVRDDDLWDVGPKQLASVIRRRRLEHRPGVDAEATEGLDDLAPDVDPLVDDEDNAQAGPLGRARL